MLQTIFIEPVDTHFPVLWLRKPRKYLSKIFFSVFFSLQKNRFELRLYVEQRRPSESMFDSQNEIFLYLTIKITLNIVTIKITSISV
jgi:hypothetical protein